MISTIAPKRIERTDALTSILYLDITMILSAAGVQKSILLRIEATKEGMRNFTKAKQIIDSIDKAEISWSTHCKKVAEVLKRFGCEQLVNY